jgi:hypothetical protein
MAKKPASTEQKTTPPIGEAETQLGLHGTNALPAIVEIAAGKSVQLGEIVRAAHAQSGLSVEDWNALPQENRDDLLRKIVADLRADPDAASYPSIQAIISPPLENITISSAPDPDRFSTLADEVKRQLAEGALRGPRVLQEVRYRGRTYRPGEFLPHDIEAEIEDELDDLGAI